MDNVEEKVPTFRRVADLMKKMTLEEKVAQLSAVLPHMLLERGEVSNEKLTELLRNGLGRIPQFPMPFLRSAEQVALAFNRIQKYAVEETRLGIPVMAQVECLNGVVSVDATSFPAPIAMASTWEPELVERAARIIGRQMRAMTAGSNALAPVVDLARDPRWGRVAETYGECPYVNTAFGVAFVCGLQNDGDIASGVQACAKHFLGYSVTQGGMNSAEIFVGERELYESYARPFEAMIRLADLRSVMCTYSAIDGVPVSFSPGILRDFLRGKLGFSGSAICDGGSIERACLVQHAAADLREAGVLAVRAGLDADAPVTQAFHHLSDAVRAGELDERLVDEACARVLKQKFDLGLFDNPYADIENLEKAFGRPEDAALSLELAEKSVTLLKNDRETLPLSKEIDRIAVVGPHGSTITSFFGGYTFPATLRSVMASAKGRGEFTMEGVNDGVERTGGFHGLFDIEHTDEFASGEYVENYCRAKYGVRSIVEELKEIASRATITYSRGCGVNDTDTSGFTEAVEAARLADVVVMTMGGRSGWTDATSGEGQDRTSIDLPGVQGELLEAVKGAGKPVILVLFNGRPMSLNWAAEHIDAIVDVWFPGPYGARAIAEVLFGDVNPGGKLPITIPRSAGQVPIYYNHKNGSGYERDRSGRTVDSLFGGGYTDMPSTPLYPFGHGLSYTTFEYTDLSIDPVAVDTSGEMTIGCWIRNSGNRAGDEVVQLYFRDPVAHVTRPVKELIGFRRVSLAPDEAARVTFTVAMNQLGFYNENMEFVVEPGSIDILIGSSSADIRLTGSLAVTGPTMKLGSRGFLSSSTIAPPD